MKKFIIILLGVALSTTVLWIRAEVSIARLSEDVFTLQNNLYNTTDTMKWYRECNEDKLKYIEFLEGLEEIAENTIYGNSYKYGNLEKDLERNGYNELLDSLNRWIMNYE